MSSTSFGVYLVLGTTYPKLSQNGQCLDRKARAQSTGISTMEFGMKLYQSDLEGKTKPIQQEPTKNSQVNTGRFESISTKGIWAHNRRN